MTSPPRVKPEENAEREKNMKTIPVRFPQETKDKKYACLTSVRVRTGPPRMKLDETERAGRNRKKKDALYASLKDEKYSIQSPDS